MLSVTIRSKPEKVFGRRRVTSDESDAKRPGLVNCFSLYLSGLVVVLNLQITTLRVREENEPKFGAKSY